MINFVLSKNGKTENFCVPATESRVNEIRNSLGIPSLTDEKVHISSIVSGVEDIKKLEGTDQNMDFLNLLGKIMDCLGENEYEQFRCGLWYESCELWNESAVELKDMINLAVNPSRYSVINPNNLYASGLAHELNLRGCIPSDEVARTDYSTVSRTLIDSGKCIQTPYDSLLYINEDIEKEDFFDGKHMPPYHENNSAIDLILEDDDGEDALSLPCSADEILRAAARLGKTSVDQISFKITDSSFENNETDNRIVNMCNNSNIFMLNDFAKMVYSLDEKQLAKFKAVAARGFSKPDKINEIRDLMELGNKLDCFNYIPDVSDYYGLGKMIISESLDDRFAGLDFSGSMESYFDFEQLGADTCRRENGRFLEYGYVGIKNKDGLKHYMETAEMSMN